MERATLVVFLVAAVAIPAMGIFWPLHTQDREFENSRENMKASQITTEDFTCIKDGLYENPEDCKSYIQCSNGQKYVESCPGELHFSLVNQRCESPCNAHCDQSKAEECGWETTTNYEGDDDLCKLSPEVGPCFLFSHRFYFDSTKGVCRRFVYGGCGGNDNRFNTVAECKARCIPEGSEKKSLPTPSRDFSNPLEFPCVLDGLYQNYMDCSTFIQCINGVPYLHSCPTRLHFSQEQQHCVSPCYAVCDERLATECGWDDHDSHGSSEERRCRLPADQGDCDANITRWFFDHTKGECRTFVYGGCGGNENNFKTIKECGQSCLMREQSLEKKSLQSAAVFCPVDGLYQNYGNCSTFIECSNRKYSMHSCPTGMHFSQETGSCDSPCDAECDYTLAKECGWDEGENFESSEKKSLQTSSRDFSIPVGFTCGSDGLYQNYEDCSTFIQCTNGGPRMHFCPLGFHFSQRLKICMDPCYAGCDKTIWSLCEWNYSETSDHADWKSPEPTLNDDFSCVKDGLYQNPDDCSNFIQCSNGQPNVQPCPDGLHFNVYSQRCESPCDAHCDATLEEQCGWSEDDLTRRTCHLSHKVGPCRAHQQRFYFDYSTGTCKQFIYGGCLGNENNFRTLVECQAKCSPFRGPEADEYFTCYKDGLYHNSRNCSTFIQCSEGLSYVRPCPDGLNFNVEEQRCELPCDAYCNETLADECGWSEKDLAKQICLLPYEVGTCRASIPRFYFDANKGSCESFYYGGCEGNSNNFRTVDECEGKCSHLEGYRGKSPQTSREHFLSEDFTCIKDGLYKNPKDCESYIQCSNGEKYVKLCPGILHYSVETRRCESPCDAECDQSLAQECGWNEYINPTENEWNMSTSTPESSPQIPTEDSIDTSSNFNCIKNGVYPDPEDCERFIKCNNGLAYGIPCPRGLHFSKESQRCVSQCNAHCNITIACQCGWPECSEIDVDCEAEPLTGPCKASVNRYFYSRVSGRCKRFTYGGCGGNTNNFLTVDECLEKCQKKLVGSYRCPAPNGKFADFFDCVSYYECKRGNPILRRCPKDKAFDHIKSKCVPEASAKCLYTCPKQEAVYPYFPDCSKYIHCVNGINKLEKCPPAQAFDRRSRECADENSVICLTAYRKE